MIDVFIQGKFNIKRLKKYFHDNTKTMFLNVNEKNYLIAFDSKEQKEINTRELRNCIECLQDHMDNVPLDSWTDKVAGINYGTYFGQNLSLRVYIL
ncbi:hypothetical protein INTERNEXUS_42 [Bacillus phage vB_BspM_Internexus]|nr:hypothetical protein INTERNEXUS_42 [Bacillus phage vB_BspM_Internexus]